MICDISKFDLQLTVMGHDIALAMQLCAFFFKGENEPFEEVRFLL